MADREKKRQEPVDRADNESIATPRTNPDDQGKNMTGEGFSGEDRGMMGGESATVNPADETPTPQGVGADTDRGTTTGRLDGDNSVGAVGDVGGRSTGGLGPSDMGPANVEGETDIGGTAGTSRGEFSPEPEEPEEG